MKAKVEARHGEAGDLVKTSGRHVGDPGRTGEIVAVLGDDEHVRYRVRWDDGHESIFYPHEGTTIKSQIAESGWAD